MTASAVFANTTAHLSRRHIVSEHCRDCRERFRSAKRAKHKGPRTGQPVVSQKGLGSIRLVRSTVTISQSMCHSHCQPLTSWIEANMYTSNDLSCRSPSHASARSVLKDEWYNITNWLPYYSTMSTTSRVIAHYQDRHSSRREFHCKKADCSRRFLTNGSLRDHE